MERHLLAIPARHGGIGILDPSVSCSNIYAASSKISDPLKQAILSGESGYTYHLIESQLSAKATIHNIRQQQAVEAINLLKTELPESLKRSVELASEKGASSWLTTLPIADFGFKLHKGAFRDALALRYGWPPSRIPQNCECGTTFSVDHAFSCPRGGFPILRHNEIRDLTANLLTEVCHQVSTEPDLQPLTNETWRMKSTNTQDGARLDIAVNGFWGSRRKKFL